MMMVDAREGKMKIELVLVDDGVHLRRRLVVVVAPAGAPDPGKGESTIVESISFF